MSEAPLVMASVAEARARMVRLAGLMPTEFVRIDHSFERVLAAPVIAARDQPPFNASAMDGYAVRSADAPGALKVVGESAAGAGYKKKLGRGEAVRIFTGAPIPDGADAIVIQEVANREGDVIQAPAVNAGLHVRGRGGDFSAGQILLEPGAALDPVAMTLAAASGAGDLNVRRWPQVAVMPTGAELATPGAAAGEDQIFESVSYGLGQLAVTWGADAVRLDRVGDDEAAIIRSAEMALSQGDMLITIGGASVGDHDLVKPALKKIGLEIAVERVNVRPGKPTWFGRIADRLVLGLPGNPASALVCAHLFLRPILDGMLGRTGREEFVRARLATALPANGPREHYLRSRLSVDGEGRLSVAPFEAQDSSLMSVFQRANAFVRLMPDAAALEAGALVDVMRLDRL